MRYGDRMACKTPDELADQMILNSDFLAPINVAKAKAFAQAANAWLLLSPVEQQDQYSRMRWDTKHIHRKLQQAEDLLNRQQSGGSWRRQTVGTFRGV